MSVTKSLHYSSEIPAKILRQEHVGKSRRELKNPVPNGIIMNPTTCYCHRPATSWVHYTTNCNTQSSAPEDGQNNCPKHVELTGIINKPLLLHIVGFLYYLYQ